MPIEEMLLALVSGGLIGIVLGMIGGGASILAVPLLVYMVGIGSPHAAIGTASVAVAASALVSLAGHARAGKVKWPCAAVFTVLGVAGAAAGAALGKAFDGKRLLVLFGLLMIAVGLSMLRGRRKADAPDIRLSRATASAVLPRLMPIALATGLAAGFFGIGGGFLIVPGLVAATAMPMANAIATSLVVVTALAMTTTASYAVAGDVEWRLAAVLILGGIAGVQSGIFLGRRLAAFKGLTERVFALVVLLAGAYVVARGT